MARGKPAPEEEEDVYELDDVVEYKIQDGEDFFLVKWKGFGPEDNTWEPYDNILVPGPSITKKMSQLKAQYNRKEQASSSSAAQKSPGRPTKRKASEEKPMSPAGNIRVHHIGRREGTGDEALVATLKWDNGFEQAMPVMKLRKKYPEELLDYLLSRVRFREDGSKAPAA